MNHYQDELLAEYNRQRVREEFEHIRLEQLAMESRTYRPGLFARTMYNLANWMIATGKQIRKRYEIPAIACNHPPTNSFAR